MSFADRRTALRRKVNQLVADEGLIGPAGDVLTHCDGIAILGLASIRYYSGFSGSNALLWLDTGNPANDILFTDSRYTEQAGQECGSLAVVTTKKRGCAVLSTLDPLPSSIALDGDFLSWTEYGVLDQQLHSPHLSDVSEVIGTQRSVKETSEVERLAAAATAAEKALEDLLAGGFLRPGVTEREVAAQLEYFMRTHGSERPSFDTIVAAGENGALPHHSPTDTILQAGDLVVIDFGATVDGYCSDCTRTFCLGEMASWQQEISDLVWKAHATALNAVVEGVTGQEIDSAARQVIVDAGYGDMFGHSTGHGVGIDVHERPYVSSTSQELLQPGSVFTIEPGIYLPGKGGVRIENTYVMTEDGAVQSFQQYSPLVQVV